MLMLRSPAFGIGWCLWRRHRRGIQVLAASLVVMAAVARVAPLTLQPLLIGPFVFGLLYLMGIFANTDTDLVSTRSGYPGYLFTLPVRTGTLILWPMVYGIGSVVVLWLIFATLILTPHLQGPLFWCPALFLGALTSCLQALSWYSYPLPYLRAVLGALVLTGLTLFGSLGWLNGVPAAIIEGTYSVIILLSAVVARRGVHLARDGSSRERVFLPQYAAGMKERPARTFASPAQAQFWLEWKCSGLFVPLLTLFSGVLLAALLAVLAGQGESFAPLRIGELQVPALGLIWLICVPGAALCSLSVGCCPRKAETFRADLTLQPFLATRPLSCLDFVGAKLRMAAASALCAGGILLLFLAAWLLLPGRIGDLTGTIGGLALPYLTPKLGLLVLFLVLVFVGGTWTAQISLLWMDLTGKRWLVWAAYSIVIVCLDGSVIGYKNDPDFVRLGLRLLPSLCAGLALLKVGASVWAMVALRRRDLIGLALLAWLAGIWLAVAGALFACLIWLLPASLSPPWFLALGVFLSLPLCRLLLAPLALHANRHR